MVYLYESITCLARKYTRFGLDAQHHKSAQLLQSPKQGDLFFEVEMQRIVRTQEQPSSASCQRRSIPAVPQLGVPQCCQTGCAIAARPAPRRNGQSWRTRWCLLRQVVRMRAVLNAGGSCPSRHEGRFTNIPPGIAMELPRHASRPAPQGAAGAFSLVVGWLTWPASVGGPVQPSCGDAESALSPFDAVRPKASLCCCESWRWRGCA